MERENDTIIFVCAQVIVSFVITIQLKPNSDYLIITLTISIFDDIISIINIDIRYKE